MDFKITYDYRGWWYSLVTGVLLVAGTSANWLIPLLAARHFRFYLHPAARFVLQNSVWITLWGLFRAPFWLWSRFTVTEDRLLFTRQRHWYSIPISQTALWKDIIVVGSTFHGVELLALGRALEIPATLPRRSELLAEVRARASGDILRALDPELLAAIRDDLRVGGRTVGVRRLMKATGSKSPVGMLAIIRRIESGDDSGEEGHG